MKLHYNSQTGEVLGFYSEKLNYANIPEPNITIDEKTHADCLANQGKRIIDLSTKKVVAFEVIPTPEEVTAAKIIELDSKYKPIFTNLSNIFLLAQQRDDLVLQEEIKAERKLAEESYAKEREVIVNGTGN